MTGDDEIRLAQRAERLLNDDMFKSAVQAIRDKALDEFKAAKPGDIEALQDARMLYEATERFINVFTSILRDGHYAQRRADEAKPRPTVQ